MKRRFLLDTGIAQDFQAARNNVREQAIEQRKNGHYIGVCVPVLGELWSGVECSASRKRNQQALIQALSTLRIWPYTTDAAEEFGRIFADLRRKGQIIQQIDMQIAAIARTLPNCVVVTKDTDFSMIAGIRVENWAS